MLHGLQLLQLLHELKPDENPFPQKRSNKMMIQELSFPQPFPEKKLPLPFPQQHINKIIQIHEFPHPPHISLHPHPQFVALKSLIITSKLFLFTVQHMWEGLSLCKKNRADALFYLFTMKLSINRFTRSG